MSDTLHNGPNLSDRRTQRTRRALWQALFALMQDHDWNDINVAMICGRADVARSTFYSHFPTKQDLLDVGFSLSLAEIEQLAASMDPMADLPTLTWLVGHLSQSQPFRRRLQGSPAGHHIMARFRTTTADLLQRDLARQGYSLGDTDLTFLIGGVFAVTEAWLATGCLQPQSDLLTALRRLIQHLLPASSLSKYPQGGVGGRMPPT